MSDGEVLAAIERVRRHLSTGAFKNETAVREAIIIPLLQLLGWDVLDPAAVIREHRVGERRVDYALAIPPQGPSAFIEVKAVGLIQGADRQLFEYAFHEGVPFAILTDGREWHFFLPGEQGSYNERRVYKLDLLEREPSQSARTFHRYLDFDRVKSGRALEDARKDYKDANRKKEADRALPEAWRELLEEREERLLDLLAEKAEALCGYRPDAEQVESFLVKHLQGGRAIAQPGGAGLRRAQGSAEARGTSAPIGPTNENSSGGKAISERSDHSSVQGAENLQPALSPSRVGGSRGPVTYELRGQQFEAKTAKEALLDILSKLSGNDPAFYERLAPLVSKRTRSHIASAPEDVYPNRPDLMFSVVELVPGWWIGLNIANREKKSILVRACEVAGIEYGDGLKIELPNS